MDHSVACCRTEHETLHDGLVPTVSNSMARERTRPRRNLAMATLWLGRPTPAEPRHGHTTAWMLVGPGTLCPTLGLRPRCNKLAARAAWSRLLRRVHCSTCPRVQVLWIPPPTPRAQVQQAVARQPRAACPTAPAAPSTCSALRSQPMAPRIGSPPPDPLPLSKLISRRSVPRQHHQRIGDWPR